MKKIHIHAVLFWFALLVIALANAIIRETTYKPFLSPYIGMWAHQISSVTGILAFFGAIYIFLKSTKATYTVKDLILIGTMWIVMTLGFETGMNIFLRKLNFREVLATYYFWKGETWIFVLLSLVISPLVADRLLMRKKKDSPHSATG